MTYVQIISSNGGVPLLVSSLLGAKFHGTTGTQHLHSPPWLQFPCRRTFWPMAHPRPPVRQPIMMEKYPFFETQINLSKHPQSSLQNLSKIHQNWNSSIKNLKICKIWIINNYSLIFMMSKKWNLSHVTLCTRGIPHDVYWRNSKPYSSRKATLSGETTAFPILLLGYLQLNKSLDLLGIDAGIATFRDLTYICIYTCVYMYYKYIYIYTAVMCIHIYIHTNHIQLYIQYLDK